MVSIKCDRCGRCIKFTDMSSGECAHVIQDFGWVASERKWLCNCCQENKGVKREVNRQRAKEKHLSAKQRQPARNGRKKRTKHVEVQRA